MAARIKRQERRSAVYDHPFIMPNEIVRKERENSDVTFYRSHLFGFSTLHTYVRADYLVIPIIGPGCVRRGT